MSRGSEYEVWFYTQSDGTSPMDYFLDAVPVRARAKIEKWIQLLEEEGPNLPRPHADVLRDKIRELRVKWGHTQYRVLYFFAGKKIVMTHGFIKKTEQVPPTEIDRALDRMKDFMRRFEKGEFDE